VLGDTPPSWPDGDVRATAMFDEAAGQIGLRHL